MAFARPLTLLAVLVTAPACSSPQPGVHQATPADAAYAGVLTANELGRPKKASVVYGYGLEVAGDRARFFACEAVDTCGEKTVEVPIRSLVAKSLAGRARPMRSDGTFADETDVLRLTINEEVMTSRGGVVTDPYRGMTIATPAKR